MATVQSLCDRAMLIHDGDMVYLGDPEEAALRYFRLNFHTPIKAGPVPDSVGPIAPLPEHVPDVNVRVVDAWLHAGDGVRLDTVEQGREMTLEVVFEARHALEGPVFGFHFHDVEGARIFGFNETIGAAGSASDRMEPGQRVRITARLENPLLPGRYSVQSWVSRNRTQGDLAMHVLRLLEFHVYGTQPGPGSVLVQADVSSRVEEAEGDG
jgi:hypothetical protein